MLKKLIVLSIVVCGDIVQAMEIAVNKPKAMSAEVSPLQELCLKPAYKHIEHIIHAVYAEPIDWDSEQVKSDVGMLVRGVPSYVIKKIAGKAPQAFSDLSIQQEHQILSRKLYALAADHSRAIIQKKVNEYHCIDTHTHKILKKIMVGKHGNKDFFSSVFSPDNKYIAFRNGKFIKIKGMDKKSYTLDIKEFDSSTSLISLLFANNDTLIISIGGHGIHTWNFNNPKGCLENLINDKGIGRALAYMPHSNNLVVAGGLCCTPLLITIVAMQSRKIIGEIEGQTGNIWCLATHNNLIASGSEDKTVCIWDTTKLKGKERNAMLLHPTNVTSVCFNPSGNYIISCTDYTDRTLYVWDISLEQCIAKHYQNNIKFVSWAQDDIIAKYKDGKVCRWKKPYSLKSILKEYAKS